MPGKSFLCFADRAS